MDRIDAGQRRSDEGVSHLVIGNAAALIRAEHAAPLLERGNNAFDCRCEIFERHRVALAPRCHDRRLVHEVRQVRAGETGRQRGNSVEIDIGAEPYLGDMDLQDFPPSGAVRPIDEHLAVESPGAQQGGMEPADWWLRAG
jgi:hypothetical protein